MVQTTEPQIPDALEPSAVFERRKKLIEAIIYEMGLEDQRLEVLNAKLQTMKDDVEQLEGEIEEFDYVRARLEEAHDGVMESLDMDQIKELAALG